jgi:hypothetical protein
LLVGNPNLVVGNRHHDLLVGNPNFLVGNRTLLAGNHNLLEILLVGNRFDLKS